MTDDNLVQSMRDFVTASNRLETLSTREGVDLALLEQVSAQRREAGEALQAALVQRGWRQPQH